jgi:hypothetical protein
MWASEYEEGWLTYEELEKRRSLTSPENRIPTLKHAKRFEQSEREVWDLKAREHRTSRDSFRPRRARRSVEWNFDREEVLQRVKARMK